MRCYGEIAGGLINQQLEDKETESMEIIISKPPPVEAGSLDSGAGAEAAEGSGEAAREAGAGFAEAGAAGFKEAGKEATKEAPDIFSEWRPTKHAGETWREAAAAAMPFGHALGRGNMGKRHGKDRGHGDRRPGDGVGVVEGGFLVVKNSGWSFVTHQLHGAVKKYKPGWVAQEPGAEIRFRVDTLFAEQGRRAMANATVGVSYLQ